MSLRKQAVRGVVWSAIGTTGNQVATLVVFVVLSRLLTPDEFGVVALASVFTVLLRLVAEQGLADAIVQHPDLETEHLDTAFCVSVALGTGLAAILAVLSPWISMLVDSPELSPVLAALSAILVLSSLKSVHRAILMRDLRFQSLTTRDLLSVSCGGAAGVLLALAGWGAWSLVGQLLVTELVAVLALWGAIDWRPRLRVSRAHLAGLFGFGASVVGFRLLRFVNTRVDNLIVGVALGTTALGYYLVAYRLLEIMIMVTTSIIGAVSFPVFSRIQSERGRVQRAYYTSIGLTSTVAFPAFLGLIAVAPEVVRLVFGGKWDPSVPTMRVLALAGLLRSILDVNGVVMKSLGQPARRLVIMGITSLCLVVTFLVVVDNGILAVAAGFTAVTYVMAPLWIIGSHRLVILDARRYAGQVAPPFAAAVVMLGAVLLLKVPIGTLPLLWQTLLLIAAGGFVYLGLLWFLGRSVLLEAVEFTRMALSRR